MIVVIESTIPKIKQSNESSHLSTTGYNSKTTIQLKERTETSSTPTFSKTYVCGVCFDSIFIIFVIYAIFYLGEGIGTQQLPFNEKGHTMTITSTISNIGTCTLLAFTVSKL